MVAIRSLATEVGIRAKNHITRNPDYSWEDQTASAQLSNYPRNFKDLRMQISPVKLRRAAEKVGSLPGFDLPEEPTGW